MAEKRMTFAQHLEELRWRLLKSVIAFVIALVVALIFQNQLIDFFILPARWAMESLNMPVRFIAIKYPAPFMAFLKICIIVAIFFSFPVFLYQMWMFVRAGLFPNERSAITSYLPISVSLFLLGCVFGFFVLIRIALGFLAMTSRPELVDLQYTISDYLDLVMMLTVITGVMFELPLVMALLSKLGIVQPSAYSRYRRLAIVAIVIVSAVVTPSTDVVSQLVLAVPLYILFELGIIMSKLERKKDSAEASSL